MRVVHAHHLLHLSLLLLELLLHLLHHEGLRTASRQMARHTTVQAVLLLGRRHLRFLRGFLFFLIHLLLHHQELLELKHLLLRQRRLGAVGVELGDVARLLGGRFLSE